MRVEQVHEYWKDPSVAKGVQNSFRDLCLPEFYLDKHKSSEMFIETVKRYLPDRESTILELGANCGRNLFHLNKAGYRNVSGVEISQKAVDLGLLNFGVVCGNIEVSSIEDYLLKPGKFDLVFTMGVLMHIHPDSNWIFEKIADAAMKYIITIENEMDNAHLNGHEITGRYSAGWGGIRLSIVCSFLILIAQP